MSTEPTGIRGSVVCLRALCRGDRETLRRFVNDPEVMHFSNVYHPITDVQQDAWFEQSSTASGSVWFGIEDCREATSMLVGTCCLVGIDPVARNAELRIRIGEKQAWGGGLGTEATRLLVRYAFQDLNLDRIWLRVFAFNDRAIRMYENLHFQIEGRLRKAAYVKGKAEDVILMGLLRSEWPAESE